MPDSSAERASASRAPSLLDRVAQAATLVSGFCLVVVIVTFGWQVFGRYVLNATPTWTEQLGLLLIVVISFLSAAVGVRENTHLRVTVLIDLLPARPRRWMRTLADLVMLAFGAALAIYGYRLAVFGWSTNIPLINIPDGWRTVPVVLGGGMIAGFSALRAARRVLFAEDDPEHEAEDDVASPRAEG